MSKLPLQNLRDPKIVLPAFGMVHDQESGSLKKFSPTAITRESQNIILDYYSNPPRNAEGFTKFLTLLGCRQIGKSSVPEFCGYVKAAYNPGFDHVCIADNDKRAEYLHRRVHFLHTFWPNGIRSPTKTSRESRQLTFDESVGGRMRILSAESQAVGVGQSPDSFHASECCFWNNFNQIMSLIWPSIRNRRNCLAIWESTPWEVDTDWHQHCITASEGKGRHLYLFVPYWDGLLNQRTWDPTWTPTQEELKLLNEHSDGDIYNGHGLTLKNLAFRRVTMDTDAEIRRDPRLFDVFYPSDDLTCWITAANSSVPAHALERHLKRSYVPNNGDYIEFEPPTQNARYVIGVDPVGFAARDNAAFHVLKVTSEAIEQVAVYSAHTDPPTLADILVSIGVKYNHALIVVEDNGVGQGVLTALKMMQYRKLYHNKGKPGLNKHSESKFMAVLVDALLDDLIIHEKQTIQQLQTYRRDKDTADSPRQEVMRKKNKRNSKREKHHWDRVSALMVGLMVAYRIPRRAATPKSNVVKFPDSSNDWTEAQTNRYRKLNTPKRRKASIFGTTNPGLYGSKK